MEMSLTSTDVSEGDRSLLSVQKVSRSPYHKTESKTIYRCKECSMKKGVCVWLCNTRKMILYGKSHLVACHLKYHSEKIMETTGTTRCNVDSDLRDES